MYHQMALSASHFAFSWSKMNSEGGADKVIVQGCQKLIDETPHDVSSFKWTAILQLKPAGPNFGKLLSTETCFA